MFIELFLFLFVVIVFIAVVMKFNQSDPEPMYMGPDFNLQPRKMKKNSKSVSFSESVTERVFGKNGVASSDNIIQINDIPN